MILMWIIRILNNCINFDLIDSFYAENFLFVQIFFLAQEIFYSVVYILREQRQIFLFF